MKKNKLLVPILAVAGLGTTIAPLVVMTSCGNKGEQGKEIDAEAFKKLADSMVENFEKNHNTFTTSEVIRKDVVTGSTDKTIKPNFISEAVSDSRRSVKFRYNNTDYENIDCNYAFGTIEELSKEYTFKFIEYTNYVRAEYNEEEESAGKTLTITHFWNINKNGFLLAKGESAVVEGQTHVEAANYEYSCSPHAVTEFNVTTMSGEPSVWLEPNTTYTVNYKESSSENQYTNFRIGDSSSGIDLDEVSCKINGTTVDLKKEEQSGVIKYRFDALKENDSIEIKFKTKESKGVCQQIIFDK